ncbi:MAG: SDR family NAD(P)-dependent oxidoreductase [Congregibacter sp.]
MQQALVVGAGGGIGQAMSRRWAQSPGFSTVWGVSRSLISAGDVYPSTLHPLATDHSEQGIRGAVEQILEASPALSRVVISLGTLHGASYQPEKSLGALNGAAMQQVHWVNCVLPLLWLAALAPGLRRNKDCRIAVLSARVGSISDNNLGGWYSYRSAKAALNMGLKCAAIELARQARGTKLMAYHPGTVDTTLSRPFQRGVPEGKLFTPEYAAECLDTVLDSQTPDGELAYLDWAGKEIPW